jgi:hypothetical protein
MPLGYEFNMCVCRCNAHRVRRIRSVHRPPKVREWAETRCRVKTSLLEPGGFPETPISGGARLSRSEPSRQKPRPRPPEGGRGTPGPRRGPDREGEHIFKETRLSAHTQTMSLHWRDRVRAWDCIWLGHGTAYGSRRAYIHISAVSALGRRSGHEATKRRTKLGISEERSK